MRLISNTLRDEIYTHNVMAGWWDTPVRPDGTTIALIHSEVTESYVGFTQDIPDHHVPEYPNSVVELADAAIRIYDFFGHKRWDVERAIDAVHRLGADVGLPSCEEEVNMHQYYLDMHVHISFALEGVRKNQTLQVGEATEDVLDVAAFELAIVLDMIYQAKNWGWHIDSAINAKRAYNAKREDHKRENRAKEHGKKF